MTHERQAIEALHSCRFAPGIFDKKFANSLFTYPESHLLSVPQRQTLWKLIHKYRRQLANMQRYHLFWQIIKQRSEMDPTLLLFHDTLDSTPDDICTRAVMADWLDEHNLFAEAETQRFMISHHLIPFLAATPREYAWFIPSILRQHYPSRILAENDILFFLKNDPFFGGKVPQTSS